MDLSRPLNTATATGPPRQFRPEVGPFKDSWHSNGAPWIGTVGRAVGGGPDGDSLPELDSMEDVLRGAASVLSRSKPDIVIEANPKSLEELGFTAAELAEELVGHGFEIAKLERLRVSPVTETEFPGYQNWVCVQDVRQLERLERFMRLCAVAPNVPLLHPLRRAPR